MRWRGTGRRPWRPAARSTIPNRSTSRASSPESRRCWRRRPRLGRGKPMADSRPYDTARHTFHLLGSAALVVAALYWGQKILTPFALAILLAFVLAPLVWRLERRGLQRVPAVLLVVCLAFVLLGAAGWAVVTQVTDLVGDLPRYKENVREKIGQLQGAGRQGLLATVQDFLDEVEKASQPADAARGPVVRLEPARPSLFAQLQAVVGPFLGAFSAALAVFL